MKFYRVKGTSRMTGRFEYFGGWTAEREVCEKRIEEFGDFIKKWFILEIIESN